MRYLIRRISLQIITLLACFEPVKTSHMVAPFPEMHHDDSDYFCKTPEEYFWEPIRQYPIPSEKPGVITGGFKIDHSIFFLFLNDLNEL